MPYVKNVWVQGTVPALNATHLNAMEAGIAAAPYGPDGAGSFVPVGDGSGAWVYKKITTSEIDAAAGILKTQLAALGIVDADVANAAALGIAKLAGYPSDGTKVLKGDGTWGTVAAGPSWTVSATPPGSPADGDLWVFPADSTNGVNWLFIYNSAETTYKWRFVGGPPMVSQVDTAEATTANTYVALTTPGPLIALTRGGDYMVSNGFNLSAGGTGETGQMSYDIGVTGAVDGDSVISNQTGLNHSEARTRRKTGIAASTTLTAKYKLSSTASLTFANRWMNVIPVRVI